MGVGSMTILAINDLSSTITVYLQAMLSNFIAFVGAAGLVVAVKAIVETSKK